MKMKVSKGPSKRGSRASKGEAAEGREEEEDPTPERSVATAPASVYASLEARPRSIYDTLEPSVARRDTGQGGATPSSSQEMKEETPRGKQKDESVYENF
ncbi:hypothetical protein CRUP_003807 [Coryphaenoides rupestris]|nr:hypothetical protein CRUP_003807 [Coryphaenoides rupestris]